MNIHTHHVTIIAARLNIPAHQVAATLELLDADNTLPFIARYRKEVTGGLDEEQIRGISEMVEKLRSLDERREVILKSIEEQGYLTDELKEQLNNATTLTALEDLYQPFKPKRRTRASMAREKGLQPLADLILAQEGVKMTLEDLAKLFLTEEVTTIEDAWSGARDIVAETISDHSEVRRLTREKALKWGELKSEKIEQADDTRKVYEIYYEFENRVDRLRSHQVLALNRGEEEKVLRIQVKIPERDWMGVIQGFFHVNLRSQLAGQLQNAIQDAGERLLLPAIERDIRRELTEKAEAQAIRVFADNLRALLCQPPLVGLTVLGIDPGFRTGCKLAIVNATGKLLDTGTIYPHEPQGRWKEALNTLAELVGRFKIDLITIGNGTASRETEKLVAELIRRQEEEEISPTKPQPSKALKYLIVNEAGASVYSASQLARLEMPSLDVSLRGAVSIARRAQDPLAELVKIDPKSIGVGMYQHDVNQKQLAQSLNGVVESVVNQVGVDVNSASTPLLTYVAGIGLKLAERIVAFRDEYGPFSDRKDLRRVSGLGPKAFEQSAGFLRIRSGANPLDASAIHPESYPFAELVMKKAAFSLNAPIADRSQKLEMLLNKIPVEQLAVDLKCGLPTLKDILEQLVRPGRDPRQDLPTPVLRSDVLKIEDLVIGMRLKGTVRNVVDFGAFVDIGVKQDGLLHRTKIPAGTLLKVGEVIEVEIQKIEAERGRIGLDWVGGTR